MEIMWIEWAHKFDLELQIPLLVLHFSVYFRHDIGLLAAMVQPGKQKSNGRRFWVKTEIIIQFMAVAWSIGDELTISRRVHEVNVSVSSSRKQGVSYPA
jgi:hypothetical protein